MLLVGSQSQRLRCDDVTCLYGDEFFPRVDLVGVHVERQTSGKSKTGVVVLELSNGRIRRMMAVDPDDADQAAERIRAGGAIDVQLHGPRVLVPVGAVALVAAIVMLGIALANMGRFDFEIDSDVMRVRRSLFGIPLGTRIVPIDGVERVVFDRGAITPVMQRRAEPTIAAGRLRIVRRGEERALSRGFYPGYALHLRAAAALRAALGLEPDEKDDAELASMPMRSSGLGERVMYAWMGMTTGSILGLAIFGLTLMLLGKTTMRANIEGWMVAGGCIPGALCGAAIAIHATRKRYPR